MHSDRHVLHVLREASGGMLTHLAGLVAEFRARGIRPAVAGPPESLQGLCARLKAGETASGDAGLSLFTLPIRDGIRPWADGVAVNHLRRTVLELAPDVVHAHGHKAGITAALALSALPRARRPPLVITVHNFLPERRDPVRAWAERRSARWALARASRVIAVSRVLEQFARGLAGEEAPEWCRVVRNGVELPGPESPGDAGTGQDGPAAWPARTSANGPMVATCMVRLVRAKGVEHLVGAAALLHGHVPPVEIWVAGDGPERVALAERARRLGVEGRVRFLGFQADPARVWAASHVAVLPWIREGSSYSALEAMAAGLPVVTFDCPGAREVISQEAGLLVAEGAPALARALAILARDPQGRRRLGRRARQLAAGWSRGRMADETLRVYREAAGPR